MEFPDEVSYKRRLAQASNASQPMRTKRVFPKWPWLLLLLTAPLLPALWVVHRARPLLFPYRNRVTESARHEALHRLPNLEDVSWRTKDDLTLRGWFAPGSLKDAVVFVHGLTSNRTAFLPEAELLNSRGHGVLLYDSRASGESDGKLATWGDRERLDIKGALDFLAARVDVEPGRVGIFGCSVGGSAAALTSAEDLRIRAVLLGPTWLSLEDELHQDFQQAGRLSGWGMVTAFRIAGVNVDAVRPVDLVRRIAPRPLLMLSGSEDTDTPPAIMQKLQAAAPGAERWVVPGAGHCMYFDASPVEYRRRFVEFFDGALGRR
ncbi:MAG: alpha/beta fold hydrolase [Polyangiaceae bacterium]